MIKPIKGGGPETAETLRQTLRRLVFATFVLYIVIFGVVYYIYTVSQSNTKGLCAIRNDSEARVQQSKKFLKEHPNGIPGISSEQLKRSVDTSGRTVRALADIHCPPPSDLPSTRAPQKRQP